MLSSKILEHTAHHNRKNVPKDKIHNMMRMEEAVKNVALVCLMFNLIDYWPLTVQ